MQIVQHARKTPSGAESKWVQLQMDCDHKRQETNCIYSMASNTLTITGDLFSLTCLTVDN